MKNEHKPHEWKEGRRKLSLGTVSTRVQAERVSCGPGVGKGTASRLLNRAKAEGIVGLRRAPTPGSQPKLRAEQLAQVRAWCWRKEQNRNEWTCKLQVIPRGRASANSAVPYFPSHEHE